MIAAAAMAIGLAGCEDLPTSAIRGYRASYPPNKAADRLQGSWSSACAGASPATQTKLLFFGRQLSVITLWFDAADCSTPGSQIYELTVGKDFSLPDDENAATQNLATITRLTSMSVTVGRAADANAESLCGQQGWTDTAAVDVRGLSCKGVSPGVPSTTPATDSVVFTSELDITFNGAPFAKDP